LARRIKKKLSPETILAELRQRVAIPQFTIEEYCFPEQIRFIQDPENFATAVCSRRSGKTVACAADLVYTAQKRPGTVSLYITLSRASAKRIVWPEILELNRKYQLNGTTNMADLSMTFPNGSVIYLSGAKDKSEIEKFRGLPLALCYIDEAQAFGSFIEELIDQVISKALYDYNGRLRVIGTPPPLEVGYFYDICQGEKSHLWSHHHWNMLQNPWLEKKSGLTPLQLIEKDCKRMGVEIDNATIQRECFGVWRTDSNALVFKYNKELNNYDELPVVKGTGNWNYIIGIDLGYDDADALAVLAYHDNLNAVFLVEETTRTKQTLSDLIDLISSKIGRYNPHAIVMDAGGLGKKIVESISSRFSIGIKAAEKTRKFEYIELLNDSMRTGRFFAHADGKFAEDSQKVEWDKDKSTGDRLVVSNRFHSDITDAVLYAFRESQHYLSVPDPDKIRPGTTEWVEKEKAEMEEAAVKMMESKKKDPFDPGANGEDIDVLFGED
jgi:hypothetical protein